MSKNMTPTGAGTVTPEQVGREIHKSIDSGSFRRTVEQLQKEKVRALLRDVLEKSLEARSEWAAATSTKSFATLGDAQRAVRVIERFGGPGAGDVHVDATTAGILLDHAQGDFIAPIVMPFKSMAKRSDSIPQIDRRAGKNASFSDAVVPGNAFPGIDWSYGTALSYQVEDHGVRVAVPDAVAANQDDPMDVHREALRYVMEVVLLKHEKRVATLLQTATTFPSAHRLTTTSKWDSSPGVTEPLADVHTAHDLIRIATGRIANVAVLNYPSALAVMRLDDFRDRIKYVETTFDKTLMARLADWFNVETVAIGMATEDTAVLGQTASYADVWADDVTLLRQETPGILYNGFGFCPATDVGSVLRTRAAEPTAKSDEVSYSLVCDELTANSSAGVHIDDVLT